MVAGEPNRFARMLAEVEVSYAAEGRHFSALERAIVAFAGD